MHAVILVVHMMLAVSLVITVLIQRSEGGGLGLGTSNMGGMMSVRGTANLLTRATAVLAAGFFATSLTLAIMAGNHGDGKSLMEGVSTPSAPIAPMTAPATAPVPTPPVGSDNAQPAEPSAPPAVPMSK